MDAIQRRLIPSYIFLTIFSLLSVFPLFWMFTAATNTTLEVAQGKIWFGVHALENFKNLLDSTNLWVQKSLSWLIQLTTGRQTPAQETTQLYGLTVLQ